MVIQHAVVPTVAGADATAVIGAAVPGGDDHPLIASRHPVLRPNPVPPGRTIEAGNIRLGHCGIAVNVRAEVPPVVQVLQFDVRQDHEHPTGAVRAVGRRRAWTGACLGPRIEVFVDAV